MIGLQPSDRVRWNSASKGASQPRLFRKPESYPFAANGTPQRDFTK
jgi:hypothetical protein